MKKCKITISSAITNKEVRREKRRIKNVDFLDYLIKKTNLGETFETDSNITLDAIHELSYDIREIGRFNIGSSIEI